MHLVIRNSIETMVAMTIIGVITIIADMDATTEAILPLISKLQFGNELMRHTDYEIQYQGRFKIPTASGGGEKIGVIAKWSHSNRSGKTLRAIRL